jgi:hypothetical protein
MGKDHEGYSKTQERVRALKQPPEKPTGKLSLTGRSMSQIPINAGDANYDPLFRYGFGLTY